MRAGRADVALSTPTERVPFAPGRYCCVISMAAVRLARLRLASGWTWKASRIHRTSGNTGLKQSRRAHHERKGSLGTR